MTSVVPLSAKHDFNLEEPPLGGACGGLTAQDPHMHVPNKQPFNPNDLSPQKVACAKLLPTPFWMYAPKTLMAWAEVGSFCVWNSSLNLLYQGLLTFFGPVGTFRILRRVLVAPITK